MNQPAIRQWLAVLIWSLLPGMAWAYVDPGSGFMLLQGLLAVIGALVLFFRNPVETIKRLWHRLTGRRSDDA